MKSTIMNDERSLIIWFMVVGYISISMGTRILYLIHNMRMAKYFKRLECRKLLNSNNQLKVLFWQNR